jgi:hypothetical protein
LWVSKFKRRLGANRFIAEATQNILWAENGTTINNDVIKMSFLFVMFLERKYSARLKPK